MICYSSNRKLRQVSSYTVEYWATFKKNEEYLYVLIWKDHQDILLNEKKIKIQNIVYIMVPLSYKGYAKSYVFLERKTKNLW